MIPPTRGRFKRHRGEFAAALTAATNSAPDLPANDNARLPSCRDLGHMDRWIAQLERLWQAQDQRNRADGPDDRRLAELEIEAAIEAADAAKVHAAHEFLFGLRQAVTMFPADVKDLLIGVLADDIVDTVRAAIGGTTNG